MRKSKHRVRKHVNAICEHKIDHQTDVELNVILEHAHMFCCYNVHSCPHMVQEVDVEVPVTPNILERLLGKKRTRMVTLTRPSTSVNIGYDTIYCHPEFVSTLQTVLTLAAIKSIPKGRKEDATSCA